MDKPKLINLPKIKRRKTRVMDFARAHLNPPPPADVQKQKDREMLLIQEKRDRGEKIRREMRAVQLAKKKRYNRWRKTMIKKLMRKHK